MGREAEWHLSQFYDRMIYSVRIDVVVGFYAPYVSLSIELDSDSVVAVTVHSHTVGSQGIVYTGSF